MKKRVVWSLLGLALIAGLGSGDDLVPVAISPAAENGPAVVRQTCPTFSWTAVSWALTYKVVVFQTADRETPAYEKIAERATPVLVKEIPGKAFAWTPSADEALLNGGSYVWYVGAMVNAAQGQWSEGRRFIVEENPAWGVLPAPRENEIREADSRQILRDKDLKMTEAAKENFNLKDDPVDLELDNILGTEGDSNTFYGTKAGNTTMSGTCNSFFGVYAGYQNANGSENTFLGRAAGYSNSSGKTNTFVGRSAGQYNTTASANTFVGFSAGYATTTGSNNVFIGRNAGTTNKDGKGNTFLGDSSGYGNSGGIYNTFVGAKAGRSNVSGSYNVFLGDYAGELNVTGQNNVYIGGSAGANSVGTGNVFIGNLAGYLESGSDTLIIDNYYNYNPLIYGNFYLNRVGINNKNPSQMFVVGTGGAVCDGTTWTDGSSREFKENIEELTAAEAFRAFKKIEPVKFNYKQNKEEERLGFIAEDVPDLVAMNDRKGLSPMDMVAMLTKVVQEQQKAITELQKKIAKLEKKSRKEK